MPINERKFIKLYWWNKCFNNKYNFGDMLSKIVVEYISKKIAVYSGFGDKEKLCAIGSIINNKTLSSGGYFWGSGIQDTNINYFSNNIKFFSVRGPLTRKLLKDKGYNVPDIYGDPALLLPLIYKPDIKKIYKYGLITHWRHRGYIKYGDGVLNIDILRSFDNAFLFIDEICSCEYILSSSLHGIILAHAYGIPAKLISIEDIPLEEKTFFKFRDYYSSVNLKYQNPYLLNKDQFIDENTKFNINKEECIDINIKQILDSFPYDLECKDYYIHQNKYSIQDNTQYNSSNITNYAYFLFTNKYYIESLYVYYILSTNMFKIFDLNIEICKYKIKEYRYNIYYDNRIIFNIFYELYDKFEFNILNKAKNMLSKTIQNLYVKKIQCFNEIHTYKYDVSFIIPVYNNEEDLKICLNSISKQNIKYYEVIFIDDCSTDNSIKIIEYYQNKYNNIKLIKNKINKGPGYSRNIGISVAQGEFIRCIDCDDILPENSTKIMLDKLIFYKSDIVKGSFICKNKKNKILFERTFKEDSLIKISDLKSNDISNICTGHWSFLIRKKIIDKYDLFYPENIRNCEDSIFVNSLIFSCGTILCITNITYEYIASTNTSKLHNKSSYTHIKSLQLLFDLWLEECKKINRIDLFEQRFINSASYIYKNNFYNNINIFSNFEKNFILNKIEYFLNHCTSETKNKFFKLITNITQ